MLKHRAVANKKRRKSGKPPKIRMVVENLDGTKSEVEPFNREAQRLRAGEAVLEPGFMGPAAGMYRHEKALADLSKRGIRRFGQRAPSAGFERIDKNK